MGLRHMIGRFGTVEEVEASFAPQLEDGEQIHHMTYGVRMPPWYAALLLSALGGGGAIMNAARHYLFGVTDRRLIVLRISNVGNAVEDVQHWSLGALPPVKVSADTIEIQDAQKAIKARLHGSVVPEHPDGPQAIAAALTDRRT